MSSKEENNNIQISETEEFKLAVKKAVEEVRKEEKAKEQENSSRKNRGLGSRSDLYAKSIKGRYWTCLLYPENYDLAVRLIIERALKAAISPIHDCDIEDKETGELKAEHYHVLFDFGRRYSESSIIAVTEGIAAHGCVKAVLDPEAYHRYLWHSDNPEKAQYRESDIIYFGGFEKNNLPSCRLSASMELAQIILDNNICSYRSLTRFILQAGRTDLYQLLMSNSNHFRSLLVSDDRNDTKQLLKQKTAGSYSDTYRETEDGKWLIDVSPEDLEKYQLV